MEEKKIPVFDFTSDIKDDEFISRYSSYTSNDKSAKYYIKKLNNEKIEVTISNGNHEEYSCIYWYCEKETIYQMIINGYSLKLDNIYVKDFDIREIDNYQNYLLKDFSSTYSFWDGNTSFKGACFDSGDIRFNEARFHNGKVSFELVTFGYGNVSFSGANFDETAVSFRRAKFADGDVEFGFTHFRESSLSFEDVEFGKGEVTFMLAQFGEGNIFFNGAQFGEGRVNFFSANLSAEIISYENCQAEAVYFENVIFRNYIDLRFKRIDKLVIEDCKVEKIMQCDTANIAKLSFFKTINLGQIYLQWENIFDGKKNAIEQCNIEFWDEDGNPKQREFTAEELASQFRMLKENFHNIGYYDDEDKAYRAYMKYHTNTPKRFLLKIFGLIGGYGTRPGRVLLTALVTIFGFGLLQWWQQWISFTNGTTFHSKFLESIYFSGITFFTIGFGDITPVNAAGGLAAVLEGFLGVTLMSYFTVALVRKLLR